MAKTSFPLVLLGAAITIISSVVTGSPSIRTRANEVHVVADDLLLRKLGQPDLSMRGLSDAVGSLETAATARETAVDAAIDVAVASATTAISDLSSDLTASIVTNVSALETRINQTSTSCRSTVDNATAASDVRFAVLERQLANVVSLVTNLTNSLNRVTAGGRENPGTACWSLRAAGVRVSGIYWVTGGGSSAFQVYCDMVLEGGGWTLVDNHPNAAQGCPGSRGRGGGPVLNPAVDNRMVHLPAYQWNTSPRMIVKASRTTNGNNPNKWVMFEPTGRYGREYPTATTARNAHGGNWRVVQLNGNTNLGTHSWIYARGSRYGTVWIGAGHQTTAACCYAASNSGLGSYGGGGTCSTWVR
jgi:hypothetical protein